MQLAEDTRVLNVTATAVSGFSSCGDGTFLLILLKAHHGEKKEKSEFRVSSAEIQGKMTSYAKMVSLVSHVRTTEMKKVF